ncbi:MAG: hypothetical protein K8963_09965, partial [Proteobacteria bacterium]|nr:hypothetical protein [Pseudomonadota bacterium]
MIIENAVTAGPITACDFIDDTMMPVSALDGLSIIVTDDRGACSITGTLITGTGPQTFTVRATSAVGTDEATITFTVSQKPLTRVSQISTGQAHTCAVSAVGDLYCWGNGTNGRLGTGNANASNVPARVGESPTWSQVSAGYEHTCAVNAAGELYCWGNGTNGRLGTGNANASNVPARVGNVANWAQVSAGDTHTCAVNTSGELYCWGNGTNGHLGTGNENSSNVPARVGNVANWAQVSAGGQHACAVNTPGELYCWGVNDLGRIGIADGSAITNLPIRVGDVANWAQVSAGNEHTCAVNTTGELYCWGRGTDSRLGLGSGLAASTRRTPVRVGTATDWIQTIAGFSHTCAIKDTGQLFCWGAGGNGRLGQISTNTQFIPARTSTDADWSQAGAGEAHTCAIKDTGQLFCWGAGGNGRLGLDDDDDRTSPVAVTTAPTQSAAPILASIDLTGGSAPARFNNGMISAGQTTPPIIFVNSGGDVQPNGCTVDTSSGQPSLPSGLRAHPAVSNGSVTCQISGRPAVPASIDTYFITAANAVGTATSASARFSVIAVSPLISDIARELTYEAERVLTPIIFTNLGLGVGTNGCTVIPELPEGLNIETRDVDSKATC